MTDAIKKELKTKSFRVAIFGSARTKPDDELYQQVYGLAKEIGEHHFDVVTGGGPGMMEAANAGHHAGDPDNESDSIGLTIQLPWEAEGNKHLELRKHFKKFSYRLDTFMDLSHVVVVTPGGIGTCLELFYTWQLIQVKHIKPIKIIVIGEMWEKLIEWVKDYPLASGLISPKDMDCVHIVHSNEEAMELIKDSHEEFMKK